MNMATRVWELVDFAQGRTTPAALKLGRAFAQELTDLDILQFALTLEHLEAAMYRAMLAANVLAGKERAYFQSFGEHEAAHVTALTQALQAVGADPAQELSAYAFPAFDSRMAVLSFAKVAEDIGVGAYQGAAAAIMSKDYLAAAGSIVQVEARHAAIVNLLLGLDPVPAAVTPSLTVEQVLQQVNPILGM